MKKVSLTIRREYFDAIVAGTKTKEYRGGERWSWLFGIDSPAEAIFLCGPRRHRRTVTHISALGWSSAPPEAQAIYPGAKYIYVIHLGEAIEWR